MSRKLVFLLIGALVLHAVVADQLIGTWGVTHSFEYKGKRLFGSKYIRPLPANRQFSEFRFTESGEARIRFTDGNEIESLYRSSDGTIVLRFEGMRDVEVAFHTVYPKALVFMLRWRFPELTQVILLLERLPLPSEPMFFPQIRTRTSDKEPFTVVARVVFDLDSNPELDDEIRVRSEKIVELITGYFADKSASELPPMASRVEVEQEITIRVNSILSSGQIRGVRLVEINVIPL